MQWVVSSGASTSKPGQKVHGIMWCDELFTLFPTKESMYVCRMSLQENRLDYFLPVWSIDVTRLWFAIDLLFYCLFFVCLPSPWKAEKLWRLSGYFNQPLPVVQMLFPSGDADIEDDNASMHKAKLIQEWLQNLYKVTHFYWPSESLILHIIAPLVFRERRHSTRPFPIWPR